MHVFGPTSTRTLYRKILRSLISAPSSIPIRILHLLSDKPSLADYIAGCCASYWSRILHIPYSNPLAKVIDDEWFALWKRGVAAGRRLPTYTRRALLWRCFMHAESFGIHALTCMRWCDCTRS